MKLFKGRKLAIATMHGKEQVIAPRAISQLGSVPFVPDGLDTDALGTFSGEVERVLDSLSVLRKKCEFAMELSGVDLAIASEGSFGQHPTLFFAPANEEIVMLLDAKNGLEIVGKKLTTTTNFNGKYCHNERDFIDFLTVVHFPTHGIILRENKDSCQSLYKGIIDKEEAVEKFETLLKRCGKVFVETDMRAMYNPTRMNVIAEATDGMLEKAMSLCEQCSSPGFGISEVIAGLRCMQCGLPTASTSAYVYSCLKCNFRKEKANETKTFEDPMYCHFCNP